MKLILHIGLEKTGTSAIQGYLDSASDVLRANSAIYSKSAGRPGNRKVSCYASGFMAGDHVQHKLAIRHDADHAGFCRRFEVEFRTEVHEAAADGAKTFIVSDELCHGRLHTEEMVQRLKVLSAGLFDAVEVLAVLRPQVELAVSLASTAAKNGTLIDEAFFTSIDENDTYYNYHRVIALWASVFGNDAIRLAPFNAAGNGAGALLRYFGLAIPEVPRLPRSNTALDVRAIAVLNALAQQRLLPNGELNASWIGFLAEFPAEQRLRLPWKMARVIQGRFERSNRELLRQWPQISKDALSPDLKSLDERGNLDVLQSAAPLAPVLRFIAARLATDKALSNSRLALLQSRQARLRQKTGKARALAEKALWLAKQAAQAGLDKGKAARLIEAARKALMKPIAANAKPGLLTRLWRAFRG